MRVAIDAKRCESSGTCAALLPRIFELQPEGATKVVAVPTAEEESLVEEAVALCPVGAIRAWRDGA